MLVFAYGPMGDVLELFFFLFFFAEGWLAQLRSRIQCAVLAEYQNKGSPPQKKEGTF